MNILKKTALAFSMLGMLISADAALLTSNTITDPIDINISTLTPQINVAGPVAIGGGIGEDINVSGSPNSGLAINYTGGWGLSVNGTWNQALIGSNDARPGSIIYAFHTPVSAVGAFMNHAPDQGSDLTISAYDENMTLIETFNITTDAPIVTPGGIDEGGFRGIDRAGVNDIYFFEVNGYVPVMSTFTFTRAAAPVAVPTLSQWGVIVLFLMFGALGYIALGRKRELHA